MTRSRRLALVWLWLSVGLVRALVGGLVPAAEARQLVAIQASASAEPHIEETSRPECASPHQDGCALCAHASAAAVTTPPVALGCLSNPEAPFPARSVVVEERSPPEGPRPRGPPLA